MSHAVHFRSADGSTAFEPVASLDAALARVEQLRNEEGVSEVRVYREVPVAFRTYYKATVLEEQDRSPATVVEEGRSPATVLDEPATPDRGALERDVAPPTPVAPPPAAATPPPGAMPLTPPAPHADDVEETLDERSGGRGSLFSRG